MCLSVYIHNTSYEHETRFLSVVNPDTGYAVYNPFQDPYVSPSCDYPHVFEPIPPQEVCLWHPKCCRITQRVLCLNAKACGVRVKYHHFCFADEDAEECLSSLNAYLMGNVSLLPLVCWYFKAGVELGLAIMHRNMVSRSLAADAAKRADLEAQFAQLSMSASYTADRIRQLARLWDVNIGALPLRPGALKGMMQNSLHSINIGLREAPDNNHNDRSLCVELSEVQVGHIPFGNDLSGFSSSLVPTRDISQLESSSTVPPPVDQQLEVNNRWLPESIHQSRVPSPCLSSSSPLSSPPCSSEPDSLNLSILEDSDSYRDEESQSDEEDDTIYPIETLVGHRPRGVARSHVTAYKIRWEGDWPRNQKQTWQRAEHTPMECIDQYWETRLANTHRRRRRRRKQ
ncbi:hypothetical protein F4818DRAFT_458087 [Hypoxylon cercidicola]|nr:hypothetical protein F4818DRAFT_458087 [Hypoxylon cercidicola]